MGVINVTPNSFSDGGKFNCFKAFQDKINSSDFDIYDIGAQSTAPFNPEIGSNEEWRRLLEVVIPNIHLLKDKCVSLDTYRPSTLRMFARYHKGPLIFNDVSGKVDGELIELLQDMPMVSYVLCHNRAPKRELAPRHMQYCLGKYASMHDELKSFFEMQLEVLLKNNIRNDIILDPCFGFCKTFEHNMKLLKEAPLLISEFSSHYWLIGVSRKSFFKRSWIDAFNAKATNAELSNLQRWYELKFKQKNLIWRVH